MRRRPGVLPGFVATVCLAGAALLTLSRTLGRHAPPLDRSVPVAAGVRERDADHERRFVEDRWRVEVSRKLEELLARVPEGPEAFAPATN